MKIAIVSFKDIAKHPTAVLSADYWVNIKAGKLPFNKDEKGFYTCISHTAKLNTATYMTESEAREVNVAVSEIKKAQAKIAELKNQYGI